MLSFSLIQRQVVQEADKVAHPIEKKQHTSRITWTCMALGCNATYHWDSFQSFSGLGKLTIESPHRDVLQLNPAISEDIVSGDFIQVSCTHYGVHTCNHKRTISLQK